MKSKCLASDNNHPECIFALIDLVNEKDPSVVDTGDGLRPVELVYGERMSATLGQFYSSASVPLQIAARAQHIERWTCPRNSYPAGRIGYLKWRKDLKAFHARRVGELMHQTGYEQSDIDRVAMLICKKGSKRDAEAQTLEDVACLVFLEHYANDFIAKHDDAKVIDILKKTARKMSEDGLAAAGRLHLGERLASLLATSLSGDDTT